MSMNVFKQPIVTQAQVNEANRATKTQLINRKSQIENRLFTLAIADRNANRAMQERDETRQTLNAEFSRIMTALNGAKFLDQSGGTSPNASTNSGWFNSVLTGQPGTMLK